MDLQEEWNSLNLALSTDPHDLITAQEWIKKESIGTYEILRKHLRYKMRWAFGISLGVLLLVVLSTGPLQYLMLGTLLCFISPAINMFFQMKNLPLSTDYTEVTWKVLTNQVYQVRKIIKMERYWGYLFMPVSPFIGLMGYILMKHNDFNAILAYNKWSYMVPVAIILSCFGIYISGKMNQYSFGPYLKKMDENIAELKD